VGLPSCEAQCSTRHLSEAREGGNAAGSPGMDFILIFLFSLLLLGLLLALCALMHCYHSPEMGTVLEAEVSSAKVAYALWDGPRRGDCCQQGRPFWSPGQLCEIFREAARHVVPSKGDCPEVLYAAQAWDGACEGGVVVEIQNSGADEMIPHCLAREPAPKSCCVRGQKCFTRATSSPRNRQLPLHRPRKSPLPGRFSTSRQLTVLPREPRQAARKEISPALGAAPPAPGTHRNVSWSSPEREFKSRSEATQSAESTQKGGTPRGHVYPRPQNLELFKFYNVRGASAAAPTPGTSGRCPPNLKSSNLTGWTCRWGRPPESPLLLRARFWRVVMVVSGEGTAPVRLFWDRSREERACNLPRKYGKLPEKELTLMLSIWRSYQPCDLPRNGSVESV